MAADQDQSIEPAKGDLGGGDGVSGCSLFSEIAEAFCDDRALRFGFRRRGVEAGCIGARVQQQRVAGGGEQFCGGAADAAGAAPVTR
ncbi:hypothetical protein ACVWZZ_003593 [Bradyrhizobium sp. LM6.10]